MAGREFESTVPYIRVSVTKKKTNRGEQRSQTSGGNHGKGCLGEQPKGILPFSSKENFERSGAQKVSMDVMQWEMGTQHGEEPQYKFCVAPNLEGEKDIKDLRGIVSGPGPMALCYKEKLGWVTESLGPKTDHW